MAAFVAVSDAAAARDFYENKLGLTVILEDDWGIMFDSNGTSIRVQKGVTFAPQEFTVLGWHVDDIEAAKAELESRGVTFQGDPIATVVAWLAIAVIVAALIGYRRAQKARLAKDAA